MSWVLVRLSVDTQAAPVQKRVADFPAGITKVVAPSTVSDRLGSNVMLPAPEFTRVNQNPARSVATAVAVTVKEPDVQFTTPPMSAESTFVVAVTAR